MNQPYVDIPELTPEELERRYVDMVSHLVLPGTTVTIVTLHCNSGFVVNGESHCLRPEQFDEQVGIEKAKEKALRKLAEHVAFHLAQINTPPF